MDLTLDHLVLSAKSLDEGVTYVQDQLGVAMSPGGQHEQMGTHNSLLSLGPSAYLEVIAIDPDAAPPDRARWFNLDHFSGPPRLTNWVAAGADLPTILPKLPAFEAKILDLERGDLRWKMHVPDDGKLPFDNLFPGLISWAGAQHPTKMLADQGCRLQSLTLTHPDANALGDALEPVLDQAEIFVRAGAKPCLIAQIVTAHGVRELR